MLKRISLILIVSILVPVLSIGADFKLNNGKYDQRFSSPEKTFTLYKQMLLAHDLKNVTECFMPYKADCQICSRQVAELFQNSFT